jgi:hypothetical protein
MLIGGWCHRDPQVRIELRPCVDSINIFAIVFYVLDSLKSSESKEFVKFVLIKIKLKVFAIDLLISVLFLFHLG